MLRFEARRQLGVALPVIDARGLQFREKVVLALDAMARVKPGCLPIECVRQGDAYGTTSERSRVQVEFIPG